MIHPESDYERTLPDGRLIDVYRQMFNVLLTVSSPPPEGLYSWSDAFEYVTMEAALEAAEEWNGIGDPLQGWIRQPGTGRRRPNGDPEREFVSP